MEISNTLEAAATALKATDIYNEVWIYPNEYEQINLVNLNRLPACIVTYQVVNEFQYQLKAASLFYHRWNLQYLCLLSKGPMQTQKDAYPVEVQQETFINSMAEFIASNITYNGTIQTPVLGNVVFSYQIGEIQWDDDIYWGIVVTQNVLQTKAQNMTG